MSSPELHTDDLLDREIRGLLTSEERARLEEHLAVCSACRFERTVRGDFRAEFESLGPTRREAPPAAKLKRSAPRARRRALVRTIGLVAVLVLVAGVATAELAAGSLSAAWSRIVSPTVPPNPDGLVRNGPKRSYPASPRALVQPPASAAVVAAQSGEPIAAPPPSSVPVAARSTKAAQATISMDSATSLFDGARQARERGEYALAVERYESLLRQFPNSPHALTTRAVLGRLLLDRGEPAAALPHFDAYLASGATSLGEEAVLGRALAFGRLGQSMQEAEAWQALLRRYPTSLHAARARERLHLLTGE